MFLGGAEKPLPFFAYEKDTERNHFYSHAFIVYFAHLRCRFSVRRGSPEEGVQDICFRHAGDREGWKRMDFAGCTEMTSSLSFVFRIIIGGIFLISGLAKISDPIRFMLTLREFRLIPEIIVLSTAIYLPWLEFILGLFILVGIMHRTASLILSGIIVSFTLAIASVILRGFEIDCGCFGLLADMLKLPDMADYKAVIRNVILLGICFSIFKIKKTRFSLEGYIRKSNARI